MTQVIKTMRRKYENIAIILFLITIVIIIFTIVLIQQNLSEITHSENIEKIQKYAASNGKNIIISLILLASVSALNIALIFKHSSESRKKNLNLNYTHPLDDEIDFENIFSVYGFRFLYEFI